MSRFENWIIPDSWAWAVMEELGEVIAGGTPSTKEPEYWGGKINWISPSDLSRYSSKFISRGAKSLSEKGLLNSSAKMMPAGSVHFSSRAPIGYVVISANPMTTNQGFKSLIPGRGVFNEFVYYYLKSAKKTAQDMASGTTFKELSGTVFGQLPVPLPPLNEQKRIVAKIEELFSELDKGIESLKTAREQLKVYRQALLKHAFEGKLTAQWREENKDKLETADVLLQRIQTEREQHYQQQLKEWQKALKKWEAGGKKDKKPAKPSQPKHLPPLTSEELDDLPELPEGWAWVKLAHIASNERFAVKAGPFGSALKKESYAPKGYKIYGQEQVIRGNPEYGDYFVDEQKYNELISCAVKPLDVLISLVGTIGKVMVLPEKSSPGIINPRLVKISLNLNFYKAHFFKAYFESSFLKMLYATESQGTTMDILNLGIIENLPYPLCSIKEQDCILNVFSAKSSEIDQLEQTIEQALQQSEALRQSILKKAFSGQLVPQDSNDEPASVLLERIRAEREKEMKKAGPKTARRGKA